MVVNQPLSFPALVYKDGLLMTNPDVITYFIPRHEYSANSGIFDKDMCLNIFYDTEKPLLLRRPYCTSEIQRHE